MRRLALALALLPVLAACGEDDPTGTPAGPAWDLAFAGEVAGTTVLLRTRGAARTVTRIGLGYPGMGVVANAAGTRLAFTTLGTSAEPPRLAYIDDAGEEPRLFAGWTESYEREPKWSPGGDLLAFTSLRDDSYGDVFAATVSGGTLVQVTNLTGTNGGAGTPDMTPAWSPDRTKIAFTSYRAGNPSVWVMNADGTQPRQVTPSGDWGDYFPTWSPAGDSIAFQRLDDASARIGLVAAAGGTPRFLDLPGDAYSPAWAPDAARLAITMRVEQGDLDVHVVGTDGTVVERIRRAGRDFQPSWLRREARF